MGEAALSDAGSGLWPLSPSHIPLVTDAVRASLGDPLEGASVEFALWRAGASKLAVNLR